MDKKRISLQEAKDRAIANLLERERQRREEDEPKNWVVCEACDGLGVFRKIEASKKGK